MQLQKQNKKTTNMDSLVARKADFVAAAKLPLVFAAATKVICCCKWRHSSYRHGFNAASKMHFAATEMCRGNCGYVAEAANDCYSPFPSLPFDSLLVVASWHPVPSKLS